MSVIVSTLVRFFLKQCREIRTTIKVIKGILIGSNNDVHTWMALWGVARAIPKVGGVTYICLPHLDLHRKILCSTGDRIIL